MEFSTTIAAEIKEFDAAGFIAPKMARRVDRCISYGMVAAKKALADAGLAHGAALGGLLGLGDGGARVIQGHR